MEQPLVSVICACYNQSKFVVESLESVKNQTYKNLEIIIWDDASKDDSVAIIEKWILQNPDLNIHFIKNQKNLGICKSLNTAQSKATGKYIQLLALDDILLPDKISRHVDILENSRENEALIFTDAYLINNESTLFQNRFIAYHKQYYSLESGNFFEDLLMENYIPAMTILFKKEIFNHIGKWDETLIYEDYDMLLRIAKNYDFIFDNIPSAKYRFHAENTHKKLNREMQRSLYKIYLKYNNHNETINNYLLSHVKSFYLSGILTDEHTLYFKINKARNFKERWIAKNKSVKVYILIDKLTKIKNLIFYW